MSTRQIASSTLWQIASQAVMAALSIVTTRFVYMGLSPELVGNYNSAYGFLQIFGILADFGLYAVAVKEVSRAEDKGRVLGSMFLIRAVILVISLSVAILIAFITPAWRGTVLPLGIAVAAFVPFFTLLAGMLRTIFQVTYRMKYVFIAEVSQRILTTTLIAGCVLYVGLNRSTDATFYYFFLAFGGIGALLLCVFSLFFGFRLLPFKLKSDRAEVWALLKMASPYGLAFLATALYRQTDITMIATLRPDYDIQNAYYGAVQRMADMAYLMPTFLLNSVLPMLSERDGKGDDTKQLLGKTFLILLLLGSISALFAFLWARPLVSLLVTDHYLSTTNQPGSDTALRLIALPMFLNGFIQFAFYVLLTKHAWRRLVATLSIGVVISIGLNLWLIPTYGFVGAGMTSMIVHAILVLILLPQSLRLMPMSISRKYLMQWIGFSLGLGFFLWITSPFLSGSFSTVIGLVAATLFMGVLAWILRLNRSLR